MSKQFMSLLAATALLLPLSAHADSKDMPGIIHVTATASADAAPDLVSVTAGVHTTSPTAQDAMARNSATMRGVFTALEQAGIARTDISTSRLSLNPRYNYDRRTDGQPQLIGYQASNMVTVKTRDLDKTGPLIDSMIQAGVTNINGVNFQVSSPDAAQASARMAAIEKAKIQARMMAQAAGVRLGRLLSLREGSSPGPIYYDEVVVTASRQSAGGPPPLSAGERDIQSTVTLSYAIDD
jgi:uncharacterized protein YggE